VPGHRLAAPALWRSILCERRLIKHRSMTLASLSRRQDTDRELGGTRTLVLLLAGSRVPDEAADLSQLPSLFTVSAAMRAPESRRIRPAFQACSRRRFQ
jgi:hypothetical protein